jgi:capsular polysaccharide biosynthesis protein
MDEKGIKMNENLIQNDEVEIDLLELFQALLKKWWLILLGGMIGALATGSITHFLVTPQYESSAMLYVLNRTTSVTTMADIQIGSALSSDFAVIATSKPVIDTAIEELEKETGKRYTRKNIMNALKVHNIDDTRLLKLTVTHEDPQVASDMANAIAKATSTQMAEIMKSEPPTIAEWAEPSEKPASPSFLKNVVLGFLLIAVIICAFIVVMCILNDSIKTEDDINKYLGVPTLATIPYTSGKHAKKKELENQKED